MTNKRHIRSLSSSFIAIAVFTGCGGTLSIGGDSSQRKKEKESASPSDDQMASDPQVVTGSYLACEVSMLDTADAPKSDRAVGCNVMTAKGKPIQVASSQSLEFAASTQKTTVSPAATNSATGYQAVFNIAKADLPITEYSAKLLQGSKVIQTYTTKVQDPSKSFSLTEKPDGIWKPMGGGFLSPLAASVVIPYATNANCPASPDAYCDGNGNLSGGSPATQAAIEACLGRGFLSAITGDLSSLFSDGPKVSKSSINVAGPGCAVGKNAGGGQKKYFNQGQSCSVVVLADLNGGNFSNPRTLVYKNSQLPFSPEIMEKRFSVMACGAKR